MAEEKQKNTAADIAASELEAKAKAEAEETLKAEAASALETEEKAAVAAEAEASENKVKRQAEWDAKVAKDLAAKAAKAEVAEVAEAAEVAKAADLVEDEGYFKTTYAGALPAKAPEEVKEHTVIQW